MSNKMFRLVVTLLTIAAFFPLLAAEIAIVTPLGRGDYQTNERIEFGIVRTDTTDLAKDVMDIVITGADMSQLSFSFPVVAALATNGTAARTEIVYVNGYLLRPGAYTLEASVNGADAKVNFNVYSHVRQSTYKTIWWGGARDADGIRAAYDQGFNLLMGGTSEPTISAKLDIMGTCTMGGGHQHDLRLSNDWSDPNVYLGAIQRGTDLTFTFRTMPNAIGSHLHDEPGLTWWYAPDGNPDWTKYSRENPLSPHDVARQREVYERAFNEDQPLWNELDPNKSDDMETIVDVSEFKLGYMDAFWKASEDAISRMKPDFLAVTQSQYGWSAIFDGYYFNVVRSMPIASGHGGYSDFGLRDLNGTMFLELSLPRQLDKPTWYLPTWYGYETPEQYKEEQYLSFITGIQALATPPGSNERSKPAAGIKESNLLMQKYGTIFEKPAYTSQDITVLYSKSDSYYKKQNTQFWDMCVQYLATKILQFPMQTILEEDILDGTLANKHKVLLMSGIAYLPTPVVTALEKFIANGGLVIQSSDCEVTIKGAVKLNISATAELTAEFDRNTAMPDGDEKSAANRVSSSFVRIMEHTKPYADAIKAELNKAGIVPPVESSVNTFAVGRQTRGDFDYVMVVNFTPEGTYAGMNESGVGGAAAATTNLTFTNVNNRAIYEAIEGKQIAAVGTRANTFVLNNVRFGGGDMKMYVLTPRAIGGVKVGTATVSSDFTRMSEPIRLSFGASIVDTQNNILSGTAPLQIVVTDNLGEERFNLYRATENGVCNVVLPLAANDANGVWTIKVTELITNKTSSNTFEFNVANNVGATAGLAHRAAYLEADKANIYEFFRTRKNITVVYGSEDYCLAAAERVKAIFEPYNMKVELMSAADANKARKLTADQLATWCGTAVAGFLDIPSGEINVDSPAASDPRVVGYDVPGNIVLIGNRANNPLIEYLANGHGGRNVLPYNVNVQFPGVGNGLVAWNLMTLGHDVEAVVAVGNDEKGLNEAIGTMFTIGIGMDPLNPWVMPADNNVVPAQVR